MSCTGSNGDQVQAASRDSNYYYNTESLIIVSHGIAFRVWKCLLQDNSVVFQSMFARSAYDGELVDGCFVLRFDDSPKEWRELFRLLYLRSADIKPGGHKVDMPFISAIVRLSHKYELDALHDWAMGYLTTYYTSSFDAWSNGDNAAQWQPDPVHAITAVNLARLTNTSSILPTAFYICATLSPNVLLRVPPQDGSTEQLTPEDLSLVLGLKARLAAENARTAFLLFQPPSASGTRCSKRLMRDWCGEVMRRLLEHALLAPQPPHPLASECVLDSWVPNADCLPAAVCENPGWSDMPYVPGRGWYQPRDLCESCRARFEKRDWELRREVWRKLPEFLGLAIEGWDKGKDKDEAC